MIEVPVYNQEGQQVDTVAVDEKLFGTLIRKRLLKQAIVMYHANKRQGTVATKSRGMVKGSSRKIYRQKHTGRARMGTIRTATRRGGGVAFAKKPRDWSQKLTKKARRLARNSAILAKMTDNQLLLLDGLKIDRPKTKAMASVLGALNITGSCLVGLEDYNRDLYLSFRNIPQVDVMPVEDFNAFDILAHKAVVITRDGFTRLQALASASPTSRGEPQAQT